MMRRSLVSFLLPAALVACGGGGNELGPVEEIQLSQTSLKVTGAPGACAVGGGIKIYIYGGFPPYKLYNSVPSFVVLDKAVVNKAGESFTIDFVGGCLDNMPITVTDEAGKIATLNLVNEMGQ
jgi:hypothetical protein